MYVDKTTNPVKAFIFLNEQESPEMVRFSLVHELGHLMTRTLDSFENFEASMHINMDITSISEELINKYREQLDLYSKALEETLQKKPYKVYIYSTYLNQAIEAT